MKNTGIINTEFGRLEIKKHLGKGKSGNSYLILLNECEYVLKQMHNEPVPYYSWQKSKLTSEITSYKTLAKLDINLPKLHYADYQKNFLIKDYIPGKVASELIAQNKIKDSHISSLFRISDEMTSHKINIDYFPNNFVINDNKVYYIDYELNPYNEKWSFENWGIYYWANSDGFTKFFKTADASYINSNLKQGIPIKEPFKEKVNEWVNKYSVKLNEKAI